MGHLQSVVAAYPQQVKGAGTVTSALHAYKRGSQAHVQRLSLPPQDERNAACRVLKGERVREW